MKPRRLTRPGFAPALPELADPVCTSGRTLPGGTREPCGRCHWCRRRADGTTYYLLGPAYPTPKGTR